MAGGGSSKKRKEARPEEIIARECLAVRLRMINRSITNIYDEALRPLGVKASQLNILVVAARLGLARPADVCRRLHLDASTLSRNVDRMRAHGWLEIVADADGRAQPFRVTRRGRRLLERVHPVWRRAQKQAVRILGRKGAAFLDQAIARLDPDP